jgi:DNA-binding MarR family transcriptional regulator
MQKTAVKRFDFYKNLSRLLTELAVMRARDLRPRPLDLDHYFILEAVATGRVHSDARMVRLLARDASFCSRAVDRLVKRGWLKKQAKGRGDDSRFQVKITRKGTGIYQDIQSGFAKRVKQKLAAVPSRPKNMQPVLKQVAIFSHLLFDPTAPGDPIEPEENDWLQTPLPGLEGGGPKVSEHEFSGR